MNLHKCIFTKNACYIAYQKMKVKGIMWHSTGAKNPNLKRYVQPDDGLLGRNPNGNHWNQYKPDGKSVCVHAWIGKLADGTIATYQTLPWDIVGWHCAGSANNSYIGFEICEDGLMDRNYFNAVYKEAVELSAYLCKLFNLNPMSGNTILDHSTGAKLGMASNHGDVMHWFGKYGVTLAKIRQDIKAAMTSKEEDDMTKAETKTMIDTAIAALTESLPGLMTKAIENYNKAQESKKPSDWAEYWNEAVALGVFDGTMPRSPLAREQAATVLGKLGLLDFGKRKDMPCPEWGKIPMQWSINEGLISGDGKVAPTVDNVRPRDFITRVEVAVMLSNLVFNVLCGEAQDESAGDPVS